MPDGRIKTASGASSPDEYDQLVQAILAGGGAPQGAPGSGQGSGLSLTIELGKGDLRKVQYVDPEGGEHGIKTIHGVAKTQSVSSIEEAVQAFYLMDDAYRDDLQKQMWFLGLIDGPNNMDQAIKVWSQAVEHSFNFKAAGRDVSPLEAMRRMTNLKAGQIGQGGSRTTTSRRIDFTDPAVARAWLREAFQNSMGRDPHDSEIRAMLSQIRSQEQAHPQVVQTTQDSNGNTTTQTMDPGFDAQAFIANDIANDPEATAHQAAATLYPALMQALQSPV